MCGPDYVYFHLQVMFWVFWLLVVDKFYFANMSVKEISQGEERNSLHISILKLSGFIEEQLLNYDCEECQFKQWIEGSVNDAKRFKERLLVICKYRGFLIYRGAIGKKYVIR